MKVRVIGKETRAFRDLVVRHGITLVDRDPDVLIAHGGDGALIGAQREHPDVPKMGIRRDDTCIKCPEHQDDVVLDRLRKDELARQELMLLAGSLNGTRLRAMNDVIIRNADARTAVRFFVSLNGERVTEEMIGDGLVACTPFGSSAYFRSITRTVIRVGIGLAFNNCTDLLNHLVIGEDEEARVDLTRGPAALAADNDHDMLEMDAGDRLVIRRDERRAPVVAIDTLRCAACRYVHAPRRRY